MVKKTFQFIHYITSFVFFLFSVENAIKKIKINIKLGWKLIKFMLQ